MQTEVAITNYRLYVSHNSGDYILIYDGGLNVLKRSFTYTGGLSKGELYSFKVSAMNTNGEGTLSNALDVYACNSPSQPAAPSRVSSTQTTITLKWVPPSDDGGCSITGYSLLTDSGTGGSVTTEVDTALNTSPETLTKIATFSSALTGNWIRFKVTATNKEGSTSSKTVQFMLAEAPSKPTSAPTEVDSETTDKMIVVTAPELTTENGGSSITGYEFQVGRWELWRVHHNPRWNRKQDTVSQSIHYLWNRERQDLSSEIQRNQLSRRRNLE